MATGRTSPKFTRVYVDQYNTFNNDFFSVGPLVNEFEAPMGAAFADEIKNAKGGPGQGSISMGNLNGYLHIGGGVSLHDIMLSAGQKRIVTVAFGIRAIPAAGDPCFSACMAQGAYQTQDLPGSGIVAASMPLPNVAGDAGDIEAKAMGFLLDPGVTARTAANAAGGVDYGAATTAGALGVLHLITATGTAVISLQHSINDADWTTLLTFALTGAAVGAEVKDTLATATVNRYTRWQLASIETGAELTFVMALIRG